MNRIASDSIPISSPGATASPGKRSRKSWIDVTSAAVAALSFQVSRSTTTSASTGRPFSTSSVPALPGSTVRPAASTFTRIPLSGTIPGDW